MRATPTLCLSEMPELAELLDLLAPQALTEELLFILNVGVAIALALVGGIVATRVGLPAVVGYLVAGVAIGPFTPGFVGDASRIDGLAQLGVVLLLFALGVQFSVKEVRDVGRIVGIGTLAQVAISTAVGGGVALLLGVPGTPALVIGASLAISSTLVMVKLLSGRGEEEALHGRVAVGWSTLQDLLTVFLIATLPALAGADPLLPLGVALLKASVFLGLSYLVGTRLLPRLFGLVARLGSSELFLLTVIATALLAALVSSAVFGLSLALGAFVAGLLVSESDVSYQAAAEVIPFRDLFAVLFFVGVGMLVDPTAIFSDLALIVLLVVVAVFAKGLLIAGSARLLGLPTRSALLLGASLAQAGEFSFLLANEAQRLEILSRTQYNVILGAALGSIVLSSLIYGPAHGLIGRLERRAGRGSAGASKASTGTDGGSDDEGEAGGGLGLTGRRHVTILGGGHVGWLVARAVLARGFECVVVDRDRRRLDAFARMGARTVYGDAANIRILRRTVGPSTQVLVVALPDRLTARLAVERARAMEPRLEIVARVHGASDLRELQRLEVRRFAQPRAEAGIELARQSLQRLGVSSQELSAIVQGLRREAYGPAER